MKEAATAFTKECTDNAWEAELYPFGENEIIRWVTNKEITVLHLKNLV